MSRLRSLSLLAVFVATPASGTAQQSLPSASPSASAARAGGKQFSPADLRGWRSIRSPVLSNDGKWSAYVLAPNEGDANVVIRPVADGGRELRFPIGQVSAQAFNPSATAPSSSLVISDDSKWVAFTIYPTEAEAKRLRRDRKPAQNRVALVNLATGGKKEFDRIRRFAFAGEKPAYIALFGYAPEAPGGSAASASGAGAANSDPARQDAADLVVYGLADGSMVNIGNVGGFGFDDTGNYLAYTIEAREEIGNGVQLRDLRTDVVRLLESDQALYRQLTWADSGFALSVLRGKPDSATKDTLYAVVAFTGIDAPAFRKLTFDPTRRSDFPAGMKVSPDRAPTLAEDLSAVFFGIREAKRAEPKGEQVANADRGGQGTSVVQAGAPGEGGTRNQPHVEPNDETPSLVLWHWKDPRLQSQQLVQEQQDKQFSYLSEYRFAENRFVRLADEAMRSVTLLPHERAAFGMDSRAYDQPASYSGRRYVDVYTIDLGTGVRKQALKQSATPVTLPAPDGKQLLYWGEDGHYYVLDAATGETRNITKGVPANFADTEDDHNDLYPPAIFPVGWVKDGSAVLLSDNWDIWKVPTRSGSAANLTVNGRKDGIRYQRLYSFEPTTAGGRRVRAVRPFDGVDFTRSLYFGTYGERTKKEGLARVEPGNKAGARSLLLADAKYNFMKAGDADVFLFTRQTSVDFPNYYVASVDFSNGRRITDANPQQKEFAWSSGARLITYVSAKGDTLQGALYLPANYEPGRKYPLLVTIYERRSNLLNAYQNPNETSAPNRSVYTSRGYAVLDPDIAYKVNDPGMSAVWCVIPAVKAAIATGIVDSAKVGLWGHSWGGYQTAFLVTQTNLFHTAIAGAPLTDLVSMYSSVYWNTGETNQTIFESSQGRFKGNFIQNYDAYIRNSPAFHADKVTTPLVILHNDKDGAVDFNQGITYYNTLRQLGKEVILLEYVGENHGLRRAVNQKDYAIRMGEWFDHYLKGLPAPEWMTHGIPRLKMEEHLKERARLPEQKVDLLP
jgi:dipeptidyl aminopeptidase/acylaminoacyl peptidase